MLLTKKITAAVNHQAVGLHLLPAVLLHLVAVVVLLAVTLLNLHNAVLLPCAMLLIQKLVDAIL